LFGVLILILCLHQCNSVIFTAELDAVDVRSLTDFRSQMIFDVQVKVHETDTPRLPRETIGNKAMNGASAVTVAVVILLLLWYVMFYCV
jgi:hypothetical protein